MLKTCSSPSRGIGHFRFPLVAAPLATLRGRDSLLDLATSAQRGRAAAEGLTAAGGAPLESSHLWMLTGENLCRIRVRAGSRIPLTEQVEVVGWSSVDRWRLPRWSGLGRAAARGPAVARDGALVEPTPVSCLGMGSDWPSCPCCGLAAVADRCSARACRLHYWDCRQVKGSHTWLRLSSRRAALGVTAGAAALFLISGGAAAAMLPRGSEPPAAAERARFSDLGSADTARPATPSATPTPTPVTTTREEIVTEAIAFEQTTVEDASLPRGETVLSVTGREGQRTLTYVITLVDGVETGRELKSDAVTTEPVAQVTKIGVYDAPPPPPTSDCDSNYAGACVPIASDVDCAWGSGNGPAYFDGVARVVGTDVYDLDGDGDGSACER